MHETSTLYNSILAQTSHRFEVKVSIAGKEYGMDAITSLKTGRAAFGETTPKCGIASAGWMDLSLYVDSSEIPRMAEIRPYVRVVDVARQSEWLEKGVYFIDTREQSSSGILTIRGYDEMLKAERTLPSSKLAWPAKDIDVVNEIASTLGLELDTRTTELMAAAFPVPFPAQYTMRETLQYIAAMYGGSFAITDENKLRLICLWDVSTPVGSIGKDAYTIASSPKFPAVSGITFVIDDETEVSAGNDNGYVVEIECPWATSTMATWLLTKMEGYSYQPKMAYSALVNPAYELGDTISIDGTVVGLFYENINFSALYTADIGSMMDEELDHEYPYESTEDRRMTRKLKNFQSELTLHEQQIAARVTRTGGDNASFGWSLDADGFVLSSQNKTVFKADSTGVEVNGKITATSGSIGGCDISDGTLHVANANIDSLNGGKITNYTVSSGKLESGAAVNRVIGDAAVTYGKTGFQGTLDQVGTNKANIDTLYGYFSGSANFSSLSAAAFWLNSYRINAGTKVSLNGMNYNLVTWSSS